MDNWFFPRKGDVDPAHDACDPCDPQYPLGCFLWASQCRVLLGGVSPVPRRREMARRNLRRGLASVSGKKRGGGGI